MNERKRLATDFIARLHAQLSHPKLCGKQPFTLLPSYDGNVVNAVQGARVLQLRLDAGLDNPRLLAALAKPGVVHQLLPWETTTKTRVYMSGRHVVVEAAWPVALQETSIWLEDLAVHPSNGAHVILGKTQIGHTLTISWDEVVHILVSGSTGSGKSTALRLIGYQASLGGVNRILLLDGKGGQGLMRLQKLPNVVGATAVTLEDWIAALGWAIEAMDARYSAAMDNQGIMRKWGTREAPRIIIIMDEFQVYAQPHKVISAMLASLLTRGRAAGIHVVAGTQKPNLEMFGVAGKASKAQFGATIGLMTSTPTASQVLRGDMACYYLQGRGDALVRAEVGRVMRDERVQLAQVSQNTIDGLATPQRIPWAQDTGGLVEAMIERFGGGAGRPRVSFSPRQIALAVKAAKLARGRDWLGHACEDAGESIAGSSTLERLLALGHSIYKELNA